ncbi:hypothetical protein PHYPSEUDO_008940 [Phytophthora pseudosyringae]|uniref:DUF7587 domain-containing protein n=1 Tax=Phytophthora pseudosyringae TaxID=221518 RepID=A0A8T1VD20_9STRA|nr:hypothetical protein PHYPSEUDO_008940 [Phytophthora pseudosyringae]
MPSSTSKIVAQYECSEDHVPTRLYRIRYSGNQSLNSRARPSFKSSDEFKTAVELHLTWCSCEPTPFVSLFADQDHAEQWAQHLLGHGYRDVVLLEIDSSKLGPLFRVLELVDDQEVRTTLPEQMYEDEYLVLRRVPRGSVVNRIAVARDDAVEAEGNDYESSGSDSSEEDEPDSRLREYLEGLDVDYNDRRPEVVL